MSARRGGCLHCVTKSLLPLRGDTRARRVFSPTLRWGLAAMAKRGTLAGCKNLAQTSTHGRQRTGGRRSSRMCALSAVLYLTQWAPPHFGRKEGAREKLERKNEERNVSAFAHKVPSCIAFTFHVSPTTHEEGTMRCPEMTGRSLTLRGATCLPVSPWQCSQVL